MENYLASITIISANIFNFSIRNFLICENYVKHPKCCSKDKNSRECIKSCSTDQFCYNPDDGNLRIALGDMNDPYSVVKQVTLSGCWGPSSIYIGKVAFILSS